MRLSVLCVTAVFGAAVMQPRDARAGGLYFSERGVRRITNSIFMPIERLAELPSLIGRKRCLLFFFDDDDWFAPDTFERVSELQLDQGDLAVFPLVRFGVEILTFIRRDNPAHLTLGARRDFGYRFHTNNYGISSALILSEHLQHLKDHILGSRYADRIGLPDKYFDMIISATNKTPCAASSIGRLPIDPAAYRAGIRRYVDNLRRLSLPPELGWMAEPLDETISLFSTV